MQTSRSEKGQTLVLTALFMAGMLGFLALALDVGILFRARRNMQIAADAAATAGALNSYYYQNNATMVQAAGQAAATANHFVNGVNGVTVTINAPPLSGPNKTSGFVEAIISKPIPTLFMGMFGRNSMGVAARAVAGAPGFSDNCNFVMNKHASDAFDMQGSATIDATHCGTYVNSDSPTAMKSNGGPNYNGPQIDVVGGYSASGQAIPIVRTGVTAESPPIPVDAQAPDTSKVCGSGNTTTTTSVTTSTQAAIQSEAATYGVVCFTNAVTLNNGVSLPGSASGVNYIFENGVTIGSAKTDMVTIGSATLNADGTFSNTLGATMIITGGTLSQKTGGNQAAGLNIYAPANPNNPYNGVALMIPESNPDTADLTLQWGNTNSVFDGLIFAPNEKVFLQDNGGGVKAAGVICDKLFVKASTFSIPSYSAANPTTTPFKQITLVE